ncbi:uncharacterized protein LOC143903962 isoform X2 [Temnothorax americanus]|uniref:uncharacterized protein LOC143903962 isoform X2 n=1 Tax=Temnothorax americanus TaxID=1964332 RepID=UPI0040682249
MNNEKLDEIRQLILALLVSRKGATAVPLLERDYYDAENTRIPYRQFGYSNLVEFLQSFPEHFIVEQYNGGHYVRGIPSEKSRHVSSLVSRQRMREPPRARYNGPPRFRPPFNRRPHHYARPVQEFHIAPDMLCQLMQHIKDHPNGVSLQDAVTIVQRSVSNVNITAQQLRGQLQLLSHQLRLDGNMIFPILSNDSHNAAQQQRPMEEPQLPSKSLSDLESPPTPTVCAAGQEDYENYIEYFSDDDDFLPVDSASNCQRRAETNGEISDREAFAMMNGNGNTEMRTANVDVSQLISDRIKLRLEELMRKHPDGIWCAELPNLYLREYKVNKMGDFMLYSADKRPVVPEPIDIAPTLRNDEDNAPIPADVSPTITRNFAPNDVMNYDDKVDKISVVELKRNRKYLGVYVIELFHPNFFWIHLRENRKHFEKMMDELTEFYECNKSKYTIAKIALKKDLNCACIYSNRWHRAIIRSVKPDFRVTVFFYDYGTLKTYSPEDVYYLHKQFAFLPAQAIPCGLFKVKPCVGDRWKRSVVEKFSEKIEDTLLAATIVTIDPEHNSMMVILTDTSEEEDVRMNDWLVNERLAQVGKTADAVDMASIMRYVRNNLNQLPTYCFAEENLMPDNCCKATSTEETFEVPLVSPKSTLHYDSHHQQQPVRPPPGFPPLGEQRVPPNLSSTNFHNGYSFANASNAKAVFNDAEATTNPFLTDELIYNDAKQIYMSLWNETKNLQSSVADILYEPLKPSLAFKDLIQLNKILTITKKVLLEQKSDCSTGTKTPSTPNPASGTTLNDAGSAPKASYNLNSETFTKDFNANTILMSNPFGANGDDRPQSNAAFLGYSSDGFTFKSNWSQSDELNPHMQIPSPQMPPPTASPAPPTFINHIPPASTFIPNTNQNGENVPVTPVSPAILTSASSNSSEFLDTVNIQFANMLKDTNPFKFYMTNGMQVPETQNERTSHNYDADITSYFSAINPQNSHAPNTETVNIHAGSNCFTPAGHVGENYTPRIVYEAGPVMYNTQKKQADANARQNTCSNNLDNILNAHVSENYTPKIVYESGPVMYNTQKQQVNADARQNTCNNNSDNIQNAQSRELRQDKKPTSQVANDIAVSYTQQHKVTNQITRDNPQVDKNYVTRPPAYYTQGSQPVIKGEPIYYQQNSNVNNLRQPVSLQSWTQTEVPEHWANLRFQNSVPVSNHNENPAFGIPTTFSRQDWNCDNGRKFAPREMTEATDSSNIFKFKDSHDKERPIDGYAKSCNIEHGSVQQRTCDIDSFVFQKIDSVKGVTFIFNIEQDGWILTCEFVEAFTNLKLQSRLLATLEAMNIKVTFKEIQRSEYPVQFSQLDRHIWDNNWDWTGNLPDYESIALRRSRASSRITFTITTFTNINVRIYFCHSRYPLNVPRDSEKRIVSISLISLQSALALLHRLKIVPREEIENAFKKNEFLDGSILPTLWMLIVTYRDFRRRILLCSNYI